MSATPAQRRVQEYVDQGITRAFEQIATYQSDGYCTQEDVREALARGYGEEMLDAWDAFVSEWYS